MLRLAIRSAPTMSMGQIGSRRVGGRTVIVGVTGEDVVCFLDDVGADAQRGEVGRTVDPCVRPDCQSVCS